MHIIIVTYGSWLRSFSCPDVILPQSRFQFSLPFKKWANFIFYSLLSRLISLTLICHKSFLWHLSVMTHFSDTYLPRLISLTLICHKSFLKHLSVTGLALITSHFFDTCLSKVISQLVSVSSLTLVVHKHANVTGLNFVTSYLSDTSVPQVISLTLVCHKCHRSCVGHDFLF